MVSPAPVKLSSKAARDRVFAWFHGRPDLFGACDAIVRSGYLGEWWWAFAVDTRVDALRGSRRGLALEDARGVMQALLAEGWKILGGLSGSPAERDEIQPARCRVKILRAVAVLEDELSAGTPS